jgi:uncharacterized protein (TIGR00369 family)
MRTRWEAVVQGSIDLPVNDTLGFKRVLTDDPKKEIVLTWKVAAEYCNTVGNLQGGILAAFADALLGGATAAHLPEDEYPALVEMKISILRPAPAGTTLTGTGRVLKAGKRVLFAEAEITDDDGRLVAKASGTEVPARA